MADMTIRTDARPGHSLDYKRAADALLLKMALEGKDFQKARREVNQAIEATQEASPPEPAPAPPSPERGAFTLSVEVDRLSIQVAAETRGGRLTATAEFTHTRIEVSGAPAAKTPPKKDPLVLDLTGSGPDTTGAEGARAFDLQGDGDRSPTSFVQGGTAFLALDRNGNGTIDSGLELFGDQHGAADGYEELARFDANGDRQIDAADPVFDHLQLLFGDGGTTSLSTAGITSLSLAAQNLGGIASGGDEILRQATATLAEGGSIQTYALGLNRFNATA